MLILSRKPGESIVIDGRITVTVIRSEGDIVKLGIAAPREVPVHRQEVYEEIQRNNAEALTAERPKLPRLSAQPAAPDDKAKPAAVGSSKWSAPAAK
ncbi:MAG TPA: carbon storage regulator CsrA [Verrucomicrobiae bacterium]|jgi:carbon storage regulator|nr:carbon storage regulator CsrA [Verrucomicrobiae bacterium]